MTERGIPAGGVRRVAIAGPDARSLVRMRGALISGLIARRHRVLAIVPELSRSDTAELTALGAETAPWTWKQSNLGFLDQRSRISSARALLAGWAPHALLAYGPGVIEPMLTAGAGARVGRVVGLVNGLDRHGGGEKDWRGLRKAFAKAHAAVAHNHDDRDRMVESILPRGMPVTVVPGAGVDLQAFAARPLPTIADGVVVSCLAPLDRERGVREYCEAAIEVKRKAPAARFLLAGPPVPGGFPEKDLARCGAAVEYLGPVADVRDVLAAAHVVVYPSYGEGMPRAVLEAMAMGRAVITTDTAGCRETVDDRVSGCLVPARDAAALADTIEGLLKRPDLLVAMARAARAKAERRFDEQGVVRALLPVLGIA